VTTFDSLPRRIAIVGGGIAGLAAGIRIAREGLAVTMFERASTIGGRARSQSDNGFVLNLGPHALYAGARDELARLGVQVEGAQPMQDGFGIRHGRRHVLPAGPGGIMRTGLLSSREKLRAGMVYRTIFKTDPESLHGRTLADWLDETAGQGQFRALMDAYFRLTTYANAHHLIDAGAALRQFQDGVRGVLYLHGGWERMVGALREAFVEAGGAIRTGERIDGIVPADAGVRLDGPGGAFEASAVVLAVEPRSAAAMLEGVAPRTVLDSLRRSVAAKAAILDVGVTRLPRRTQTFAIGIDRPLYFQVPSLYAAVAPKGMHLLNAATYLAVDDPRDARTLRAELEGVLDLMQPGWRDAVVMQRFLPALSVSQALPLADGDRPAVDGTRIPGVYLAGDWAGGQGMLAEAAFASARAAAGLAVAHAMQPDRTAALVS
jgi:phytoene dehydrogenase-like protein